MTTDEQTPSSFEGRPLPRPDEAPFDQGLAFDLETMNRRRLLRMAGLGVSVAALAACGEALAGWSADQGVETPWPDLAGVKSLVPAPMSTTRASESCEVFQLNSEPATPNGSVTLNSMKG